MNESRRLDMRRAHTKLAEANETIRDLQEREIKGLRHHIAEAEQIAGKALGYPWYKDDQKSFPGATEADGVCVGEHVVDSIVQELANAYEKAKARIAELEGALAKVTTWGRYSSPENDYEAGANDMLETVWQLLGHPYKSWRAALTKEPKP